MIGYYYILSSSLPGDFFVKLGITTRHPKYRYEEHVTSFSAYIFYIVFKLYDSTALHNLERYILAKTRLYNFTPLRMNNECRSKLDPAIVQEFVIDYLVSNGIKYDILTGDAILSEPDEGQPEIYDTPHIYFTSEEEYSSYITEIDKEDSFTYELRDYQVDAVYSILQHFGKHNSCILNWACGLGKTLTSINILYEYTKKSTVRNILVGVPSIAILNQWSAVINTIKYFNKYKKILITGEFIKGACCTTDKEFIKDIYNTDKTLIITTYSSSHLISNMTFDFAILDEIHHLSGKEIQESRGFKQILRSTRRKTISLTATMKNTEFISNFNEDIFGPVIDSKSMNWAITNKYITDYNLLVMKTQASVIERFVRKFKWKSIVDISLFLAAFSVLYGMHNKINNMSHTFIYTNSKADSTSIVEYIRQILKTEMFSFDDNDIYYCKVDSDENNIKNNIENFKCYKFGIIVCVYMLGEGFDEPIIDSVCFSKNMFSVIRIVQTLLRGNRLLKTNPNKINTVIFPTNTIETVYNSELGKLIDRIRNEDEAIEDRVNGIMTDMEESLDIEEDEKKELENTGDGVVSVEHIKKNKIIHSNITKELKFVLFDSKRMSIIEIFKSYVCYHKNNYKFKCIADYKKSADGTQYHLNFITDPEKDFAEIWDKSKKWYEFLAIDDSEFPTTKELWKEKCLKLGIKSTAEYEALCEKNNMPMDCTIYYELGNDLPWLKHLDIDFSF